MKTNFKSMSWIMAFAMITGVSFSACTEEDEQSQTPVFPEPKTLAINAGETQDFTFETNMDWQLTSTAVWCKFVENNEDKVNLQGVAGKNTITVKITDEGQSTGEESKAQLELAMGGEKKTIAEITRSALGYELKVYDMEGNEIDKLELGYNTYVQFKVVANYRFSVPTPPACVKMENDQIAGNPNQEVTAGLQFVETETHSAKYPFTTEAEEYIVFKSEDGRASKSVPVYFNGMNPNEIEIQIESSAGSRFNWAVQMDGSKFAPDGSLDFIEDQLDFTVKVLNDAYQIVYMELNQMDEFQLVNEENNWMKCTQGENGKVSLKVDPIDEESGINRRTGYIFAIPQAKYEKIEEGKLLETIIQDNDIVSEYVNNVMIHFVQKQVRENFDGFDVTIMGYLNVETEKVTDAAVAELFGTEEIYEIQGNPKYSYTIAPFFNGWTEYYGTHKVLPVVNEKNESVAVVTGNFEPSMTEAQEYVITFYYNGLDEELQKSDLYIKFPDANGTTQKILVIRTVVGGETESLFSSMNMPCPLYDGNDKDWLKNELTVENIWKFTVSQDMSQINFNGTILSIECRNCDNDQLEVKEFSYDDEMADVYKDENTFYIWQGDGTTIDYNMIVVITAEDGKKYGLVVLKKS